jgi:hypothetical protein
MLLEDILDFIVWPLMGAGLVFLLFIIWMRYNTTMSIVMAVISIPAFISIIQLVRS